jgi:hypothetical protein
MIYILDTLVVLWALLVITASILGIIENRNERHRSERKEWAKYRQRRKV